MKTFSTATHWGAYNVETESEKIVSMHPFSADPDPSEIGLGMPQAIHDSIRIETPMIRKGWLDKKAGLRSNSRGSGPYISVSWEIASEIAAKEIDITRKTYGNNSIFAGSYGWASAGRFHHANSQLHRFMAMAGGYVFSKNTYSLAAGDVILPHIIGMGTFEQMESSTPLEMIADNTQLLISFGGIPIKNTQVEGGGMGMHHVRDVLKKCKAKNVNFINFGPICSDMMSELDAEWHANRPNTDTAIMLGLAHTILSLDLHDKHFLEKYCVGFEDFSHYLLGKSDGEPKNANWASNISGINAQVIKDLAVRMTKARTLINLSWSTQRQDHGEQAFWMGMTLASMLGQIGLAGGGIGYGYGATNLVGRIRSSITKPALPRLNNKVPDFIPVARIADMLLNPGTKYDYDGEKRTYPNIKMIYWCGGNPFHHHQDLNRLLEAWQRPETIIVNEPWWNANARHADIIFPVATTLERNDIGGGRRDKFIFAMQKAIEPVGQSRTDYEIFSLISKKLGFSDEFTEGRSEKEWLESFYSQLQKSAKELDIKMPNFSEFWSNGFYEFPEDKPKAFLHKFRSDPERNQLRTPSGKIEIYSSTIDNFEYEDCPGHPVWLEPCEWLGSDKITNFPLHLITNQPKTRLHSQYDNGGYSLKNKIKGREPVSINPKDAHKRGIKDGDIIKVYNSRGACLAGAIITEDVMPSVIQISTGAWFDPLNPGQAGSMDVHGNPNILTLDKGTSKLAQGPSAMSALVEVEVFEGELPPIKIFNPPLTEKKEYLKL
ncbi:MAG: molybdopterin-dependent oxidoreductase [Rhodospirillales bacterium]